MAREMCKKTKSRYFDAARVNEVEALEGDTSEWVNVFSYDDNDDAICWFVFCHTTSTFWYYYTVAALSLSVMANMSYRGQRRSHQSSRKWKWLERWVDQPYDAIMTVMSLDWLQTIFLLLSLWQRDIVAKDLVGQLGKADKVLSSGK